MFSQIRTKRFHTVIIACLWLANPWFSNTVSAETTDEVRIRADYMKFDLETGDSIYEGNVSIVQGGIRLTGDKVVIRREQKEPREISDIEITGNPARYQQDENTDNRVDAVSHHMKYSTSESRLVMSENARLEQSGHTVESQRIIYDTENKVIIAGTGDSEKTSGDRVNITLTPKKSTPGENR